jgi:hypothetical protein
VAPSTDDGRVTISSIRSIVEFKKDGDGVFPEVIKNVGSVHGQQLISLFPTDRIEVIADESEGFTMVIRILDVVTGADTSDQGDVDCTHKQSVVPIGGGDSLIQRAQYDDIVFRERGISPTAGIIPVLPKSKLACK